MQHYTTKAGNIECDIIKCCHKKATPPTITTNFRNSESNDKSNIMAPIFKAVKKILSRKPAEVALDSSTRSQPDLPTSGVAKIYQSFGDNIRSLIEHESKKKILMSAYALVALLFLVMFVPLCYRRAKRAITKDVPSQPVANDEASTDSKDDSNTASTSSVESLDDVEEEELSSAIEPLPAENEDEVNELVKEIQDAKAENENPISSGKCKEIATHNEILRDQPLLEEAEETEADDVIERNTPYIESVGNSEQTMEFAELAKAEDERPAELESDDIIVHEEDYTGGELEQPASSNDTMKEGAVIEEVTRSPVPLSISPLEGYDTTTPLPSKERSSSATTSDEGSEDNDTPVTPTSSPPNSPGGRGLKKKMSGSLKKPVKMLSATMKRINSSQSLSSINGNK
mmetsp:Transcript_14971/g.28280  ORF Transcript_14971/g.28280 Transcript_14971/m.28280 type:complete len:401 (+) Transcript_14971:6-1208(+)